jgi:hypothetical protein
VGTTNACELPLNVVIFSKPNVLTGLDQTVCGKAWLVLHEPSWTLSRRRGGRVRPTRKF